MFYSFVLLLSTLHSTLSSSRYHVILRIRNITTFRQPTSAQFRQLQSTNSSKAWECTSGANPIIYPGVAEGSEMRAKSIDVRVDGELVECLGLCVRVVVGRVTPLWVGEKELCPGYLTSTTEMERSDSEGTQFFQFRPPTLFHVYTSEPSEECATLEPFRVPVPRINLKFSNDTLVKCSVLSSQLDLLSCNMTVSTTNDDVIALAVRSKEIYIPKFIWQTHIERLTCSCDCRIKRSYIGEDPLQSNSIDYIWKPNASDNNIDEPNMESTQPKFYGAGRPSVNVEDDCNNYLIVICALSGLLVILTIVAIFFFVLSSNLRRRLMRLRNMRREPRPYAPITRPAPTQISTAPPTFESYSHLHRMSSECHHYNSVCLNLSNLQKSLQKTETYERPITPVYQRISYKEDNV